MIYRMREQLEPLALAESLPQLTDAEIDRLGRAAGRDRGRRATSPASSSWTASSTSAPTADAGSSSSPATVTRLWNSTQHYRRAFMQLTGPGRMWVVNAEHRLLLDAVRRRDEVDAGRFLAGHIRRTRIELSRPPRVFGGLP